MIYPISLCAVCATTQKVTFLCDIPAVLFAPDGYLLSNAHVVGTSESVQVTLTDGRRMTASVIGTDPSTDLAVCQIDNLKGEMMCLCLCERVFLSLSLSLPLSPSLSLSLSLFERE